MFETIRYELEDGLATITLARPEKRNAITVRMFDELGEASEEAARDPAVRAVVLRGEGPSFCSGLDVSAMGELGRLRGDAFRDFHRRALRPFVSLATMPKPAIGAVHGHAVGAGLQLALACDLRVAASDAKLAMLELRFGLVPDLAGPHRLARLIGPARAKELIWSARTVEAEEAERLGIVNRVVPAESLDEAAAALAREVTAWSPTAVGLVKGLVDAAPERPLEAETEREAEAQERALESDHHRESVAAFLEKRPPRFA